MNLIVTLYIGGKRKLLYTKKIKRYKNSRFLMKIKALNSWVYRIITIKGAIECLRVITVNFIWP